MRLANINLVTKMKKVYIPPMVVRQILSIIDNLNSYIQQQDLSNTIDYIHSHIEAEGQVHQDFVGEEFKEQIIQKLYIEWKQKYPNDDYSTFLTKLLDQVYFYLVTTPNNISDEDKAKYVLTVCSFIYHFNKHHNFKSVTEIHNGIFVDKINSILSVIQRFEYRKNIIFYINKFNEKWLMLNKITDENTIDQYDNHNFDNKNEKSNYPYGKIPTYEMLDYFMSKYQELLDWQYNWEHRRTIGLFRFFSMENFPYYQGIKINNKFMLTKNINIFFNLTFKPYDGITHLLAFRNNKGSLYFSLFYEHSSRSIKILINNINHPNQTYISDVITNIDITKFNNYKFVININKDDNNINIKYVENNGGLIQEVTINQTLYFPYNVEFMELAYKFDTEDKYQINAIHELLTYDKEKHSSYHNTLLGIS